MGGSAAAAVAYQQARLISKKPEEFGKGASRASPPTRRRRTPHSPGEMVPTLGIGIPGSDTMVLLLGALTIHGIVPGPLLAQETPEMLHAAVAGLLGTAILLARLRLADRASLLKLVTLNRSAVLDLRARADHRRRLFDAPVALRCEGDADLRARRLFHAALRLFDRRRGYRRGARRRRRASLRTGLNLTRNDWLAFVSRPLTATILTIALASSLMASGGWCVSRGSTRRSDRNRRARRSMAKHPGA